jgi:hypothetical protein
VGDGADVMLNFDVVAMYGVYDFIVFVNKGAGALHTVNVG